MKQTSQYQAMKQEGILLNANESSVNLPLAIRNRLSLEMAQMRCLG